MTRRTEDTASGDVATFHHSIRPEGPHRIRTVTVEMRHRSVLSRNDGHSSEERDVMRYWGVAHTFVTAPGASLQISWLEYIDESGRWEVAAPDMDLGDQFSELERGMELLGRIGKVIERRLGHANREPSDQTFGDPSVVLDALRNARSFYEIERHELHHRGYWIDAIPALSEHVA